jgi:alkanesulfonate monooxygenase SsuD/methylene tetrahydromethanopterin reductase-like flavin-dependent oxidoreductase (luciferase family)
VRILLDLPTAAAATWASAADAAGIQGVVVPAEATISTIAAPPVVLATTDVRVVVPIVLGTEHPVTLAEELVVLDALSAGRIVALVDTGDLDVDAAQEDLSLVRRALSGRIIRHHGPRWTVPAGLAPDVSDSLIVTPGPVQIEIPIWLTGEAAPDLTASSGLPVLATEPGAPLVQHGVQPARARLSGDLAADRDLVLAWRDAGATHLVVAAPPGSEPTVLPDYVARYLIPEVAMVDFPRLIAESVPPPDWPTAPLPEM